MGCDGGTIPRRDELVKTKKKKEEKDREAATAAKWQYCALSCTKLRPPIVACELGQLYNKVAIIEFLLNKDAFPSDVASHVRSLKDVVELKLTEKAGYQEKAGNGGEYVDTQNSRYICPVVGLDMNGKYKFFYSRQCGCVLSERALKEVKSDTCHSCGKAVTDADLVVINGTDEEVSELRAKMDERRALAKSEKKGKKRKVEAKADSAATDATSGVPQQATTSANGSAAPTAAAAADEVAQKPEQSESKKMKSGAASAAAAVAGPSNSKQGSSKPLKTTKTSTDALLSERAKGDYSVAKDPTASEVYKSIFTSHKSAQERPKNNWVTFNPLYY